MPYFMSATSVTRGGHEGVDAIQCFRNQTKHWTSWPFTS